MTRDFDVDDLKVRRLVREPEPRPGRRHLPVAGPPRPQVPNVDEAFGGNNDLHEVAPPDVLRERVVQTLKGIFDPEIPLNVYDLGLIYGIDIEGGDVEVRMTLTAPACPVAGFIVTEVAQKVGETAGVRRSHVKLVWDPPWTKDRMTEDALLELGLL